MSEDQSEAKEQSKFKDNTQGISPLLITGLLAILGTVTGELVKGYWSNTLADKDFHSKLILDALKSENLEERKKSRFWSLQEVGLIEKSVLLSPHS
jgi:hypothetical protein